MNMAVEHKLNSLPALGEVSVHENVVPTELQREILKLVRSPIWAYGWKSIKDHDRYCFWHAHFAGGDDKCTDSCEQELDGNDIAKPINELWKYLASDLLKGHVPLRAYANGHTYGVEGYIHTDSDDKENYFTTIYYAHGIWDMNWAGETVFYSADTGEITKAVHPKPGRVIMFRGATPHVARSPSRECPELRISIVFKTKLQ